MVLVVVATLDLAANVAMSGRNPFYEEGEKEQVRQEDGVRSHGVRGKREHSRGGSRRAKRQRVRS